MKALLPRDKRFEQMLPLTTGKLLFEIVFLKGFSNFVRNVSKDD